MPHDLIPRAHLFGNPVRISTRISPDGRCLAWLAPLDGVLNIWIAPIDAPEQARAVTADRKRGIHIFQWTYREDCLVYLQDEAGDENFHVYLVDLATGATRDLTPFEGISASLGKFSRAIRDRILVRLNRRNPKFHDPYTLDLATGELSLVEENPGFVRLMVDEDYNVRLAVRNAPDGGKEILRRREGNWSPWIAFAPEDVRTSGPNHLDTSGKILFLRDSRGRDKSALFRVDLETGESALLAAHALADIGWLVKCPQTREPRAYAVETERLEYFAIDREIQPDLDFLTSRNIGDWFVLSRSEDDRLWVVGAHSDTRPFGEYLYDRNAKTLRLLHFARPELVGAPLRPMRPVTIRSRDGHDLVSYLTLPRPAKNDEPPAMVLLVHGGPWGRDSFGFNLLHQWLADRGYAVLSVNFRGSTGFGKAFVNAGDHEWGRRMDDDLLDAVDWAIRKGVADPRRIAIMGGSYGGYATLVGLTRNPNVYACGIDVFGPSNLETLIEGVPPYWEAIRSQFIKAVGDPATEEGRRLLHERSPLHDAHRIVRPLLVAQGANDPRVKRAESDRMVEALARNNVPVAYLLFPDEGHGFARPENRLAFHALAENFLAQHLGGRAEPVGAEDLRNSSLVIEKGAAELSLPQ